MRVASPVDADTPLISSGLIDSLHIGALLAAIETEFGVRIPLEAVGVDNFDTPRQMQRVIGRRRTDDVR
jgi:acyl carrier protein